jgi:hypothetical protein
MFYNIYSSNDLIVITNADDKCERPRGQILKLN